jgi:hypothetical protein
MLQLAILQATRENSVDESILKRMADIFKKTKPSEKRERLIPTQYIADTYGLEKGEKYSIRQLLGSNLELLNVFGFLTDEELKEKEKLELEKKEQEEKERLKKEQEEKKAKAHEIVTKFGAALRSI